MNIISIFSTIVTFIFAWSVLARWRLKKPMHLLLWGIGLIFYGIGTLTEVILSIGFNAWILKLWYLTGAMLTAAWLGQGTVYLLVRKPGVARSLMLVLLIASLLSAVLVFAAPVDQAAAALYSVDRPASEQYKEIMTRSGLILTLTILLNIYGTITLVGGAIYSAYLFWRKKVLFNRMLGNILIAAGALLPAVAGSFVKVGLFDWLYISEFFGVVLMYAGFILATTSRSLRQAETAPVGD